MVVRVILKKSWTNKRGRVYPVGTVLQVTPALGSELLADKYAEKYDGAYPPKAKLKMDLSKLNKK